MSKERHINHEERKTIVRDGIIFVAGGTAATLSLLFVPGGLVTAGIATGIGLGIAAGADRYRRSVRKQAAKHA
jgi:hypothetical protein